MNILHVVSIYFSLPYFIGKQFRYFAGKGYKMHVVCSSSEYLHDYASQEGFDYIETPINRSISIREDLLSIRNICKYIKRHKIDIIVGHTPKGGLLAMLAGWLCRVPKRIYFRHGLVYETSQGLERKILVFIDKLTSRCATTIVCVSPSVLQRSIADGLAPAKKQMILGKGTCNGVDTIDQFNPDRIDPDKLKVLKAQYGIKDGDFIIGYSGRLVRDKGIGELIQAFDRLENADNCKLLLVGMFEERDTLPDCVKARIAHDSRIIHTGFINGGMALYYSLMDVYVLASYREGFPTGILEAQAMGKPIITTRVTGCIDAIVENETGLFADHNPADIAKKIDLIRLFHAIDGHKGRTWVQANFDSQIVWKEIEKLYQ